MPKAYSLNLQNQNPNYTDWNKSQKFWPLWEVTLVKNWNEENFIKSQGEPQIIRLFYTEQAAYTFANEINELLEGIEDVPDETR